MDIGQMIKEARVARGLSMNDLAKRAGVGQSGLSEIEAAKRSPNFDSLERIITALGVTLAEFFSDDAGPNPVEAELLAAFRGLPEDKREQVLRLIKAL